MVGKDIEKIYGHIDKNLDRHVKRIQEFLRQPSVASQDLGIRDCADLLLRYIGDLGFEDLELVETARHPVVCGRYDVGSKTTLIIHGMYDTGAVGNEKEWSSPPFEARIVETKDLGRCIVAPGALRKAPNATFVNALESILAIEKTLPVNLVFNVEGEHSLMSPNYPEFYEKYKDKIKDADGVLWPMETQDANGKIEVKMGEKGMMGLQLECSGKDWGRGPTQPGIHSADSGIVDSPTWRLMNALCTMTRRDGNDIAIDGYHDDVVPPSRERLQILDDLAKVLDEEAFKKDAKIERFVDDLHGRELLKRYLFEPVLCIGNIHGGSPRPAPFPVARVDIHIRLVPEQSVDGILKKVRNHLDRRGYKDIKIKPQYGVPWVRTDPKDPLAHATIQSYRDLGYHDVEIWPNGPRTPPTGVYELPYMDAGLGYGTRGTNEMMVVDKVGKIAGVAEQEKHYVYFLYKYAELSKAAKK